MKVEDFDSYDQALLRSALKAGRLFARIIEGSDGPWVASTSMENPLDVFNRGETRFSSVVYMDEIDGLAESESHSAATAGRQVAPTFPTLRAGAMRVRLLVQASAVEFSKLS